MGGMKGAWESLPCYDFFSQMASTSVPFAFLSTWDLILLNFSLWTGLPTPWSQNNHIFFMMVSQRKEKWSNQLSAVPGTVALLPYFVGQNSHKICLDGGRGVGRKMESRLYFLMWEWQSLIAGEHVGWEIPWPYLENITCCIIRFRIYSKFLPWPSMIWSTPAFLWSFLLHFLHLLPLV